jgi:hypothetical protein
MHIPESQLANLRAFGYTEAEARFLHIAATHSGYFTVQQFLSFAQASYGKRNARFVEKLFALGHASAQRYRRRALVYHLDCRRIYAAIGKDYLRRRREHELRYIKTRLLGLDFILGNAEENYFETAEAKQRYFSEGCKVDPKLFSAGDKNQRAITFGDGFPLCIAYPAPDYDPVATFTYIDPGHRSIDPYIAHLRRYRPLFRQLRSFQFFYIATELGRHQEAEGLFALFAEGKGLSDLLRLFEVQTKWENRQYNCVTEDDLIFANEAKKRFRGQVFETMKRLWRRNQLPKDFEPQHELFAIKRTILFRAMVLPGQEGIFGDSAKSWGDAWQIRGTSTLKKGSVSSGARAKPLNEGWMHEGAE